MAYDTHQSERIQQSLKRKGVTFYSKNMMGGLCIMVDEKMCIGLLKDKKTKEDLLFVRIGEEAYEEVKILHNVLPMDFTGRPMKGYAYVTSEGFDMDEDLDYWVQRCLDFNPQAKSSKKKK